MEELWSVNASAHWNASEAGKERMSGADLPADGSPALRVLVSVVYSLVCAAGLIGNMLVLVLVKVRGGGGVGAGKRRATINLFIVNLAVTDLQFVLTLPFWAADTLLDFSWPFGHAMCKVVLSVTVMNMYASVFFLTAMSVTRYCSVASALPERAAGQGRACPALWAVGALWAAATLATAPTAIFSTVRRVAGERLCLLDFPEGEAWLALYHVQKILVAFVLPALVVCACYLLLLRLLRSRTFSAKQVRRRARITRSVTLVVVSFFVCWMPNHAITLWGVLVKFNVLHWDRAYYLAHTYVHPLSVCLAHTNSCLNPVLYCLMRPEFRARLKNIFWKVASPAAPRSATTVRTRPGDVVIPLNNVDTEHCRLSVLTDHCDPVLTLEPHGSDTGVEDLDTQMDVVMRNIEMFGQEVTHANKELHHT
ncbi:relaxin-3 receptor 1 [Dunckerocampus dactyliophorus]|uniref:relaxin-3 receptor 1 n=1 Tax=Dunckerocampus dactyliophorus TaxID=161453 RepID=UPI002404AC1E|nr:relaxin-3 receptor 1 [Dunckerocampus dactyliophorus]